MDDAPNLIRFIYSATIVKLTSHRKALARWFSLTIKSPQRLEFNSTNWGAKPAYTEWVSQYPLRRSDPNLRNFTSLFTRLDKTLNSRATDYSTESAPFALYILLLHIYDLFVTSGSKEVLCSSVFLLFFLRRERFPSCCDQRYSRPFCRCWITLRILKEFEKLHFHYPNSHTVLEL